MPYLICESCKGYYELQEGESIEDFLECRCGGKLSYIEEFQDYIDTTTNNESHSGDMSYIEADKNGYVDQHYKESYDGSFNKNKFFFMVIFFLIISIVAAASFTKFLPVINNSTTSKAVLVGSDYNGSVNMYIYNGSSSANTDKKKIAIITGIHPREKLSRAVWSDLLKNYMVPSGWEIDQYDINVDESPNDFNVGRNNGETLAAKYILPNLRKSQYELVIVCHDHEPGYGEGFFFATPRMDDKSVKFADSLKQRLSTFNYYKNSNNAEGGSSNIHFTDYVVADGYRTIVYEMPGLSNYSEAYNMTKQLLVNSIEML
jgi:hypothetical protein